jgi:hypothetical protein
MEDFVHTLEECGLSDLGFKGPKFTWNNGRGRGDFTQERLDRAIANFKSCDNFDKIDAKVLASRSYNHNLLLLSFIKGREQMWKKRRSFCVEASWSHHAGYKVVVKQSWRKKERGEDPWKNMHGNLTRCQRVLKQWVREEVGNASVIIQDKTNELEHVQCREDGRNEELEKTLKKEINTLLEQEDDRWRQRAKEEWLKNDNRNTKYFHVCVR